MNFRWFRPILMGAFYALIALLASLAAQRLSFVSQPLIDGEALDFSSRYIAVRQWFSGEGLYQKHSSTYPPASYLILWPLMGWLSMETASRIWGVSCAFSLAWLAKLIVCRAPIRSSAARWLLALLPFALTATSAAIWLGQFVPVLLAILVASVRLVHPAQDENPNWKREAGAAILMTLALVKPSVSLPFLWLLVGSPTRFHVAVSVVAAYGVLTLVSLWFQKNGLQKFVGWAETVNRNNALVSEGYANLRVWLASLGLKRWSHPAALLAFGWLGFWSFRNRGADMWLRLGVTALVARLWTYYNSYDDLLLILPMLALLQIGEHQRNLTALALFVVLALLLLMPAYRLFADSPIRPVDWRCAAQAV